MNERTSKLKNGLNGIKTRRRVQKEPGETWTEWDWIGLPKDRWRWRRRTEQIYQLIECLDIHRRIGHPGRTVSLQPAIHHESISVSTVNASLLFPMRFNFSIQRLETIKIQANEYREQKKKSYRNIWSDKHRNWIRLFPSSDSSKCIRNLEGLKLA